MIPYREILVLVCLMAVWVVGVGWVWWRLTPPEERHGRKRNRKKG